jgi:DNA-binding response OmpR family regulator/DNA-binding CsgD family transcriptional regulator
MSYSNLVLVVDDSPDTLGMLSIALEEASMTTLVALEGSQALNISKKMMPDVILLDAIMPRMDGFETCRRLKADASLKNIPVIFMTGLSDTESVVKGFEVGGVDYLTKPINPLELIARINVHLLNARTTLSAQTALDSAGQSIFAITGEGKKIWATPQVNELLELVGRQNNLGSLEKSLSTWLTRRPVEGDKMHFKSGDKNLTVVYFGLSSSSEHMVRLIDDDAVDEVELLKSHFGITPREADVFLWLAKGKTNREIALVLDVSPRTVNKHLEQLFKKLDVDNRTSAAAMAIQCLHKQRGD